MQGWQPLPAGGTILPPMTPSPSQPRRIPRWKIAGGAVLHFAPVVYLLAAAADALRLAAGPTPSAAAVLTGVLRDSLPGLAVYTAIGTVVTGLAFVVDRLKPETPRPTGALPGARGRFGPQADAALAELAALPADEDERAAAVLRHAEDLVHSALEALEAASSDRRGAIVERTAAALETLGEEARALRAERSSDREARAATLAGFVTAKYGRSTLERSSDSAGE